MYTSIRFAWISFLTVINLVFGFQNGSIQTASNSSSSAFPNPLSARIYGDTHCIQPSSNFDPLTASPTTIALYGFPNKPTNPRDVASWAATVRPAKHRMCGAGKPTIDHRNQTTYSAGDIANFWSGYMATAPSGYKFKGARGYYTPSACPNGSSTNKVLTWVGLGGINGSANLWQAGVEEDNSYKGYPINGSYLVFWYERLQSPSDGIVYISPGTLRYNCGDQAYSYVDYNFEYSGGVYAYITDLTIGIYYVVDPAVNQYLGGFIPDQSTVEWIDERPECIKSNNEIGYTQLANFGFVLWDVDGWYVGNNTFYPVGSLPHTQLKMTQGTTALANSSSLFTPSSDPSNTNGGFYDFYDNAGTNSC